MEKFGIDDGDYEIDDIIDDTSISPKYCPFCNGTEVSDIDLLSFLLDKYNLEKDKVTSEYLNKHKVE
ncbi:hypothetical protein [Paenibacillus polymyxa]|uniref:hypothetical protein n=1 Tax=Paenibacillus polymyxa TaxID=1406 RepID=UPI0003FDF011|nr:hypothetical protein [Paenibacillus polymyxa]